MKVKINVRILLNIFIFVRDEETTFSKLKIPSEMEVTPRYTLHYAARADIWRKKKLSQMFNFDFSANFHLTHDFFWRGFSQHPKNWKTQKGIYKYQFKGV